MPLPTIQQLNDEDNGHLLHYASMPKTVCLPKFRMKNYCLSIMCPELPVAFKYSYLYDATAFRCDIPVVFCRLNTIHITSSRNTECSKPTQRSKHTPAP